jgi:hypothetical protein
MIIPSSVKVSNVYLALFWSIYKNKICTILAFSITLRSTDTSSKGDLVDQLTVITEAVKQLQAGQQSLQSLVESKLDRKNDFIASIDEKFKAMRAVIDLDLAVHKG